MVGSLRGTLLGWAGRLLALLGLGVLFLLLLCAAYVVLAWPRPSDGLMLAGLRGTVRITVDDAEVVHIEAQDPRDVWFALGAVHARDRLWQLEINRRIAQGRLSELFGEATLETDRFLRTLGLVEAAKAQLEGASPALREQLQAYAQGINAWVAQMRVYPPEFLLLKSWTEGPYVEDYRPEDAQAWTLVMALDLGGNHQLEAARLDLARFLDQDRLNFLMPPVAVPLGAWYRSLGVYRALGQTQLQQRTDSLEAKPDAALPGIVRRMLQVLASTGSDDLAESLAEIGRSPEGRGSNSWVIDGSRSASGKPLLANDPHLGLTTPSLWQVAHVRAPGIDVIGGVLVGVPAVVIGRTAGVAWGFVNTGPDVQDLMLEQLHPSDPSLYRIAADGPQDKAFAPFATREEVIAVRGGAAQTLTVRHSRHGPVITDVQRFLGREVDPSRYAVALRWSALDPENRTLEAAIGMMRAQSVEQLREALRGYWAPAQNVVMADTRGDVAFQVAGAIPRRNPLNLLAGTAPVPGWDPRYRWQGYHDFRQLPRLDSQQIRAQGGTYASANEKPFDAGPSVQMGEDWTRPDRKARIVTLLAANQAHDLGSMRRIQADHYTAGLHTLIRSLAKPPSNHMLHARAWHFLEAFDGQMDRRLVGPTLATAWVDELTRALFADEIGAARWSWHYGARDFRAALEAVVGGREAHWCDDRGTSATESCEDVISQAWDAALDTLSARLGPDPATWTWGRAHQAVSVHRPFSQLPGLRHLFELRVPSDGDTYTVNAGRLSLARREDPYRNQHAPSLRFLHDLAQPEASRFMMHSGQSGWFFTPAYRNRLGLWSRVEDLPLRMDPPGEALIREERWYPRPSPGG